MINGLNGINDFVAATPSLSQYQQDYGSWLGNTVANIGLGVITSICICIISLPQLWKLFKEKETKNVNFTSFWFYHLGIFLWLFYATFTNPRCEWIMTLISEFIALFINSFVMFALYWYKRGGIPKTQKLTFNNHPFKRQLWWVISDLSAFLLVSIAFIIIFFHFYEPLLAEARALKLPIADLNTAEPGTWSANASLVIGLIIPAFVALPFTPQLIKSFRTHQWQGISPWLFVLYTVNNIAWIAYFALWIKASDILGYSNESNIGGLVWQSIGFVLFDIQLFFTLWDRIKTKKSLPKTNPLNVIEMPAE